MYVYTCRVMRVVDGDTCDLEVDIGFRLKIQDRFRLYGINAPEPTGPDREAGNRAKVFLQDLVSSHKELTVKTHKDDRGSFGRWLCVLFTPKGENINEKLVTGGHAQFKTY